MPDALLQEVPLVLIDALFSPECPVVCEPAQTQLAFGSNAPTAPLVVVWGACERLHDSQSFSEVALVLGPNVSAGHFLHEVSPFPSWNVPGRHALQFPGSCPFCPRSQGLHFTDRDSHCSPAIHLTQDKPPLTLLNQPCGQSVQRPA